MKKRSLVVITSLALFAAACSGSKETAKPKPGAVVTTAEMPVAEEAGNNAKFSINVIADSSGKQGVYTVAANSGPYSLTSQFTMPKGGEDFEPLIKKGSVANTFVIGFKVADDTTFYDYFEVSSKRDTIRMKYLKAYSFQ
ncbi:MAG: hypothetical protein K0Q79_3432 [Flavipsychrobacter sp.]|jgi:hypothetical protein|nr:hypothetical protein [Flavipsychrobacter sp.]